MDKLKIILPLLITINVSFGQVPSYVYFEYNEDRLNNYGLLKLDSLLRFISEENTLTGKFILKGHTDDRGTEIFNIRLGSRRVKSVMQYIQNNTCNSVDFDTVSHGESTPRVPNNSNYYRSLNRRVEIIYIPFQPELGSTTQSNDESPPLHKSNDPDTFREVTGDRGAILRIPRGAFDPIPINKVEISIKEILTVNEMIVAGIFPEDTAGNILSSGGMVFFETSSPLSGEKEVEILIPAGKIDRQMNVYTLSEKNSRKWKLTPILWEEKTIDGKPFYSFKATSLIAFNIDKPTGKGKDLQKIKVSKGKIANAWAYSVKNNTVFRVYPRSGKKIQIPAAALPRDTELVLVTRRFKRIFLHELSLAESRYVGWRDLFIIGKGKATDITGKNYQVFDTIIE